MSSFHLAGQWWVPAVCFRVSPAPPMTIARKRPRQRPFRILPASATLQVTWQDTRRDMLNIATMRGIAVAFALFPCTTSIAADRIPWPSTLPVYDHIVIVIEENKDVEQIFGSQFDAPYIRQLAAEGAVMDAMFGEEH